MTKRAIPGRVEAVVRECPNCGCGDIAVQFYCRFCATTGPDRHSLAEARRAWHSKVFRRWFSNPGPWFPNA